MTPQGLWCAVNLLRFTAAETEAHLEGLGNLATVLKQAGVWACHGVSTVSDLVERPHPDSLRSAGVAIQTPSPAVDGEGLGGTREAGPRDWRPALPVESPHREAPKTYSKNPG